MLAQNLIAALKGGQGEIVGLDIGQLNAIEVDLGKISVTDGTGVRIREAIVEGTFKTDDINVGDQASKKKK